MPITAKNAQQTNAKALIPAPQRSSLVQLTLVNTIAASNGNSKVRKAIFFILPPKLKNNKNFLYFNTEKLPIQLLKKSLVFCFSKLG